MPTAASPVYAFNTDSMQGIGLAIDLTGVPGASVYRATTPFDFNGVHFDSGAAMVSGVSLADVAARALARDTPVYGLPRFPAPRQAIARPKIALWTGSVNVVANPEFGRLSEPFRRFGIIGRALAGLGVHDGKIVRGPRVARLGRLEIPALRGRWVASHANSLLVHRAKSILRGGKPERSGAFEPPGR